MRSSLVLGVSRLITVAVDHVPCTTKDTTHCCHKDDVCMSNGLCWAQRNGDMVLSRGSCSNVNWGEDCVAARPCGMLSACSRLPTLFCCGSVVSSSSDGIKCSGDGPFPVPTGTVIPGVAALASVASTSSSSPSATCPGSNSSDTSLETSEKSNDQSTKLPLGLGLGLPLGIIAGTALIWGAWERKKTASARSELDQLKSVMAQSYQYAHVPQMQAPLPVEMGHNENYVAELPSAGYSK
ncbi:hypothetical protein BDW72DRAFT_202863 [Aspergillus terricola var. indicus]